MVFLIFRITTLFSILVSKGKGLIMKNALALFLCTLLFLGGCDCHEDEPAIPGRCDLAPDSGPCYAMFKKYYYDKTTRKCEEFIWGGCGGVVPFQTLEECQQCEGAKRD
jgi:hypothetical protein